MNRQPNILFIITDQQHSNMLSCAGNKYVHTPAMDRLASEGVRFTRAYCTNPVCIASRFSLMTGHMPSAIGMLSNRTAHIDRIPDTIRQNGLGHLVSQAGYDAAYAGKVHLPKLSAEDIGFDYISSNEREPLADACTEFIKKKKDKPFFLVASCINPHDICHMAIRDFASTDAEKRILQGATLECATLDKALSFPDGMTENEFFNEVCPPLPPNFEPHEDEPEAIRIMLQQRPFRLKARDGWSRNRWRQHRWAYARLTEMVDSQISQILEALTDSGQDENTIVVFTSDHGDMDSAHRMEHKSTLYDEACRIPLIVRPAGGMKGRVDTTHLVSNGLDLLPTFCEWAGAALPPDVQGNSLASLIDQEDLDSWRSALPVECAIGRAIITQRFKYCVYDIGETPEQLMDLESDPWEQCNVVNSQVHRAEVEKLSVLFQDAFGGQQRHAADVLMSAAHA